MILKTCWGRNVFWVHEFVYKRSLLYFHFILRRKDDVTLNLEVPFACFLLKSLNLTIKCYLYAREPLNLSDMKRKVLSLMFVFDCCSSAHFGFRHRNTCSRQICHYLYRDGRRPTYCEQRRLCRCRVALCGQ